MVCFFVLNTNIEIIRKETSKIIIITKYRILLFNLGAGESSCDSISGMGSDGLCLGSFLIFIFNGGARKLNLGTDI